MNTKFEHQIVSNNLFFFYIDEETLNQNQISTGSIKEERKYENPKLVNEFGISYVTMKDFKFDLDQQAKIM